MVKANVSLVYALNTCVVLPSSEPVNDRSVLTTWIKLMDKPATKFLWGGLQSNSCSSR